MKRKLYKPNCFEKTEVRWGIFSFFSSTNVDMKNVCPIAYNVWGLGEGCLTDTRFSQKFQWQLLPNRCYVLGGLSALFLI